MKWILLVLSIGTNMAETPEEPVTNDDVVMLYKFQGEEECERQGQIVLEAFQSLSETVIYSCIPEEFETPRYLVIK